MIDSEADMPKISKDMVLKSAEKFTGTEFLNNE